MKGIPQTIYSRRKRFLPEYRELFAALLNIPDKDVRDRVTDAINGIQNCPACKTKKEFMTDVGTQTDDITWQSMLKTECEPLAIIVKSEDVDDANQNSFEKRRRKRKRNCPKVVKTAQHSSNVPVLKKESTIQCEMAAGIQLQPSNRRLMRIDSDDDAVSLFFANCDENVLNIDLEDHTLHNQNTLETVKHQMKIEWEICEKKNQNGFLPIHEAIVQNELHKLKRQIYVWTFRRRNLMTLLTEDNDNLIQLAVKENCIKSIIDELLKEDLNLNDIDDDYNNIIHLAITHLSNDDDMCQQKKILQTLESLLEKIDLKILLQKNDDGLTPLHLAVKRNEFLMAEKILSVVDERLKLKSVVKLNDPCADVTTFLRYYCRQCDSFEGRETNDLKQEILNSTDMKRGCSVLYFAMELGHEHLVYLLLAHMCNPLVKNLAGSDARTYYTESGKNFSIARVLDKLPIFIQK